MTLRTMLTRCASVAGLTTLGISTAVGLAGAVDAAPLDQVFLDRLNGVGITWSNPYATVRYAHSVCRELSRGTPHSRVVDFVASDNPAFDREDAADYVVVAYMTYCPQSN